MAPPASRTLQGVELQVTPDEVMALVYPPPWWPDRAGPHRIIWDRPPHTVSVAASLTNSDTKARSIRLTARCGAEGWRDRWACWTYVARKPRELLGGDALLAQDALAPDASSVTLLTLPGETREATLRITPVLDGETAPGDYVFDVVADDAGDATTDQLPVKLSLRHPPARMLRYLPGIYAEAVLEGRSDPRLYQEPTFLERMLLGFGDAIDDIETAIANLHLLFSPDRAPADFLPWLSSWLALALDENWPEIKRRRLIKEATDLYRWRGTRRGLRRYLEIYADVEPDIDDQPIDGMKLGPRTLLGAPDTRLGHIAPHTFVVTLAVPDPADINEQTVRDIIETQKPAHTAYALRIVRRAGAAA